MNDAGTNPPGETPPSRPSGWKPFVAFWKESIVPFLAVFGAIGAFFSLTDRFFPPSVEVLGVLPVYVRGEENLKIDNRRDGLPRRGVSFILLLQGKNREVPITELEISGRLYLTLNEWVAHEATNGMPLESLAGRMN